MKQTRNESGPVLTSFINTAHTVHIVMQDATIGHTLIDIVVDIPTRRHLEERAAHIDMLANSNIEHKKKAYYRRCLTSLP